MKVEYVKREALYPRFGAAADGVAYVRDDLPEAVKAFVEIHELYHLQDSATWWVWREIKANVAGAWRHPWGFALCVIMSFAPHRLRHYWARIIKGE